MYKKSLILLLAIVSATLTYSCQSDDGGSEAPKEENRSTEMISNPTPPSEVDAGASTPVIKFDYDSYDFGQAWEGDILEHEFYFTNTGVGRLIITNVKPTCGCTIPYFPKEPIEQGERGSIKIEFNTDTRIGHQDKSVTVYSNGTPNKVKLRFTAEVKSKSK